tara:strand:+ start:893 stop:1087 length:195 start_codon:yes stop_codon:yes gene_type:complete
MKQEITNRNGKLLAVGQRVKHFDRESGSEGVIVAIKEDRLPLIEVDCGKDGMRGFPYCDLICAE